MKKYRIGSCMSYYFDQPLAENEQEECKSPAQIQPTLAVVFLPARSPLGEVVPNRGWSEHINDGNIALRFVHV